MKQSAGISRVFRTFQHAKTFANARRKALVQNNTKKGCAKKENLFAKTVAVYGPLCLVN